MKKHYKHLVLLLAGGLVMMALPFLGLWIASPYAYMTFYVLLFLIVDPIYALASGIAAGLEIRRFWYVPLLNALLYWAGTCCALSSIETAFLEYALIYLAVGIAAMLSTWLVRRAVENYKRKKAGM